LRSANATVGGDDSVMAKRSNGMENPRPVVLTSASFSVQYWKNRRRRSGAAEAAITDLRPIVFHPSYYRPLNAPPRHNTSSNEWARRMMV
jgi:hypothetical protein